MIQPSCVGYSYDYCQSSVAVHSDVVMVLQINCQLSDMDNLLTSLTRPYDNSNVGNVDISTRRINCKSNNVVFDCCLFLHVCMNYTFNILVDISISLYSYCVRAFFSLVAINITLTRTTYHSCLFTEIRFQVTGNAILSSTLHAWQEALLRGNFLLYKFINKRHVTPRFPLTFCLHIGREN